MKTICSNPSYSLIFLAIVVSFWATVHGQEDAAALQDANYVLYACTLNNINATTSGSFDAQITSAVEDLSGLTSVIRYSVSSEQKADEFVQRVWDERIVLALQSEQTANENRLADLAKKLGDNYQLVFRQLRDGRLPSEKRAAIKALQHDLLNNIADKSIALGYEIRVMHKRVQNLIGKLETLRQRRASPMKTKMMVGWGQMLFRLPKAIVKKGVQRGAAATTLAVCDGPLPVGDAIALALDLGISIYTVYELCQFHTQIKQSIHEQLQQAVQERRAAMQLAAKTAAKEMLDLANEELARLVEERAAMQDFPGRPCASGASGSRGR